jgi:hypothetical protein
MFAEVYAASRKTAGLTAADVAKPHTGEFVEGIENRWFITADRLRAF